jgi:phospholipase C
VQKALAAGSPAGGSLRDVKHGVCLMQENRSFNHYFGTMAGVRGFDDPHAISLPSGRSVFYQPDTEAYAKASLKKYSPMAARNDDKNVFSGLL